MTRREVRIAIGACLAGVVASGAVAEAKTHYLITRSSQVKPGALAAGNLSAAAQKSLRGKAGPQGIQGIQGIQGPKGDPGTPASGGGAPTGAAGGSLAGTYPNPTLAPGAVGGPQVADHSLPVSRVAADVDTFSVDAATCSTGCVTRSINASAGASGSLVLVAPPESVVDAASCSPMP